MTEFAKLFTFHDGQVLILREQDDDGAPCISTRVLPEGLDVCKTSAVYKDSESGERTRDKEFAKIDEAKARELADAIYKITGEMTP